MRAGRNIPRVREAAWVFLFTCALVGDGETKQRTKQLARRETAAHHGGADGKFLGNANCRHCLTSRSV